MAVPGGRWIVGHVSPFMLSRKTLLEGIYIFLQFSFRRDIETFNSEGKNAAFILSNWTLQFGVQIGFDWPTVAHQRESGCENFAEHSNPKLDSYMKGLCDFKVSLGLCLNEDDQQLQVENLEGVHLVNQEIILWKLH